MYSNTCATKLPSLEWKTNMHHVTLGDGCRLIDIYAECLIPALHNLQQRLANFAQPHDDNRLIHSFDRILPTDDKVVVAAGALLRQIRLRTGSATAWLLDCPVVSLKAFLISDATSSIASSGISG